MFNPHFRCWDGDFWIVLLSKIDGKSSGAAPDGDADALAGMLFAVLSLERTAEAAPWLEEATPWIPWIPWICGAMVEIASGKLTMGMSGDNGDLMGFHGI